MFIAGKDKLPINNGAVLNISQIIRAVMLSAAEAELGALFINAKTAVSMQQTLIELGHPQPRTPIQIDNATAHALLTNKILPKALKAMDMRCHWLRCRDAQDQFRYYWRPGTQNLADYFTKHHPATHHKNVRPTILTAVNDPEYRKLFVTQDTSSPQINVKSGGTIQRTPTKTSVVTNSFVKTLFQTPKFRNMLAARSALESYGKGVLDLQVCKMRSELHTLWCNQNRTKSKRAIRIAHLLVRSKSHQKQACEQNCTLAGAIKSHQ